MQMIWLLCTEWGVEGSNPTHLKFPSLLSLYIFLKCFVIIINFTHPPPPHKMHAVHYATDQHL